MRCISRVVLLAATLCAVPGLAAAQYSLRVGALGGSDLGDWGPTWGWHLGLDEQMPSGPPSRWSLGLDIGHRSAELRADDPFDGLYLNASAADTNWVRNEFSLTEMTISGRYEPCRTWLGFHQTKRRIISPFFAFHMGYARMDQEQSGLRTIYGISTAHGFPVGLTLGVRVGWGRKPELSLEENPLISYYGVEIALEVRETYWVKDKNIVDISLSGRPRIVHSAPTMPSIMLRVSGMFQRAYVE